MPISIVVGGQYGSEGKGKTALEITKTTKASAVVRIGGTNSGHIGSDRNGNLKASRQLPASALAGDVDIILPAGSQIDPNILLDEINRLQVNPDRLYISENASVINSDSKLLERDLVTSISSTGSGTGGAVIQRIKRCGDDLLAKDHPVLNKYVKDTNKRMETILRHDGRIVIEGSQGFGLSLLHGHYPNVTSRDTTAAAFLSEAGLSPFYVDDITMVIRTYPIRVAGNSGPLPNEISWDILCDEANIPKGHKEFTTVTSKVRRVARFDPDVVKQALFANKPSRLVLNHVDYFNTAIRGGEIDEGSYLKIRDIEKSINRKIDWLGINEHAFIKRQTC